MASDSSDSHRKHRRSPSADVSPEESKRHKHRHHHRRHRHRHRHESKKHAEERERTDERETGGIVEDERETAAPRPVVDYDDMEEGEIVDDDSIQVDEAEIYSQKVESDVESGELKDVDGPIDTYTSLPAADESRKSSKSLKSPRSNRSDDSKRGGSQYRCDKSPPLESIVNGGLGKKSSRSHERSKSPTKESRRHRVRDEIDKKRRSLDLMEVDEDEHGDRSNLSSRRHRENRHKLSSRSPSNNRRHVDTSDRSRSVSLDRMRERARSQSILHDERSRSRHHHERDEKLYENGMFHYDDERDSHRSTDHRLGDRDSDRGKEKSSSYHRSMGKKEDSDAVDKEREEINRDKTREKERDVSQERHVRDYARDRDWEKERDRNRRRDRESEKECDRHRGKSRESKNDMDWDREHDREMKREKDRGWSKDRDLDRQRRRDDSVATDRDRIRERELDSKGRDRDRRSEMDRVKDVSGDRDRNRDKLREVSDERHRRYHKYDYVNDGYGYRDRRRGYDEVEYRRDRDRRHELEKDRDFKDVSLKNNEDGVNRDEEDLKKYQERVELALAQQEEDDIEKIKEESRRRREAILQKYKAQQSQQQAVSQSQGAEVSKVRPSEQPSRNFADAGQGKNGVKYNGQVASPVDTTFHLGKSPPRSDTIGIERSTGAGGLGEGTPKSERSNDDMFGESPTGVRKPMQSERYNDMFSDDIFGESPAGVRKMDKGEGLPVERGGLHDNWDDPEGYYSFRFGEILDSRYEITAAHGKGVFSTVVRAKDLKAGTADPEEVAIKIIRNNETMLKAGTEELVILKKLVGADPDDRRHCVRYLSHFKYRNHLCIVFESLHMNLREVLKKFGRNIGLKLTAVRAYAKQLFIALKHLKNCGVLHSDIKPDNMLVNDTKNVLKLCDFGNAMFAGKNEITPYLVSRFYRAPEIILGLPYDHPMDIWSVGCCLYELYTGKVLFPGPTNNDMLRLHMELKGPFPKKMLRKGAFIERHFDQDLNFLAIEEDPVTKKTIRRLIVNIKPKDFGTIIRGSPGEDPKMLANFKDLLDKIFILDPDKRLTVSQALNHSFITGK